MITNGLLAHVKKHEGFRDTVYRDPHGVLTIGWGHNLNTPLSQEVLHQVLMDDLAAAVERIRSEFPRIPMKSHRFLALVDMVFNLGWMGFYKFERMIHAIYQGDWDKAADEALASKWAQQVGRRAIEDAFMLRHNRPMEE